MKVLARCMERVLGAACALVLFAMMLLTAVDVVMRYVFSSPLSGAYDLTEVFLLLLVFGGLPVVSLRGLHITTDMIDRFLSARMRGHVTAVVHVTWVAALAGLGRLVWIKAGAIAEAGDTTQTLSLKLGPIIYAVSVLLLVTAVAHLMQLVSRECGGDPRAGQEIGPM